MPVKFYLQDPTVLVELADHSPVYFEKTDTLKTLNNKVSFASRFTNVVVYDTPPVYLPTFKAQTYVNEVCFICDSKVPGLNCIGSKTSIISDPKPAFIKDPYVRTWIFNNEKKGFKLKPATLSLILNLHMDEPFERYLESWMW